MIYLDKSDKKSKFHYINGAGIKCILQNKEKLSGKLIIGDKVIRVSDGKTYNSMADFVKENPNAAVTHDMSTTKGYLAVRINMTQITKEELIKRIQEQRKVTKEMYHLKYTPDCLAYYENENLATVLLETPVTTNIKQYAKRCWALARALNGLTNKQMKESGDVYTIYDNLQRDLPLFVLKDDTIIFSETSDHEEDSKKKEEAQLPEFNGHPQSMDELYKRLEAVGKAWHAAHDSTDQKTGAIIPAKMNVRDTLDLLEHYVTFYHLYSMGEDTAMLSQTPLYYLDYDRGIYLIADDVIAKMIQAINRNITSEKQRRDMIHTLEADRVVQAHILTRSVHPELFAMQNGVYDLKKHIFREFDFSKDFFISKADVNYNPKAVKEPEFDIPFGDGKVQKWKPKRDWFDKIADDGSGNVDKAKLKLLLQVLFLAMTNSYNCRKVIFCINNGQPGTSKSTFLELCESLVGQGNYAVVNITEWNDATAMNAVRGKSLLVGDDFDSNNPIYDYSAFKNIASDGPVRTKLFYHNPYSAPLHIFAIQVANGMPNFRKPDSAVFNRIRVIRFDHFFGTDNPYLRIIKDKFIYDNYFREWLAFTLLNMFGYYDTLHVYDTKESQREVHTLEQEQDTLAAFINGRMTELKSRRVPTAFMYKFYENSSKADGFSKNQILNRNQFTRKFRLMQHDWSYYPKNQRIKGMFDPEDSDTLNQVLVQVTHPAQTNYANSSKESIDAGNPVNPDTYKGGVFENLNNPTNEDRAKKAAEEGKKMRQDIADGKYTHEDLEKDVENSVKAQNDNFSWINDAVQKRVAEHKKKQAAKSARRYKNEPSPDSEQLQPGGNPWSGLV